MRFKGLVFDLDGTLIHTKPEYRYLIVGKTLEDLGIEPVKEHIDSFWFEGNRNELIKKHFGIEPEKFWKKYLEHENPELRKKSIRAYEDTEFLKTFKQRGKKFGIVTGSPEDIFRLEMKFLDTRCFDSFVLSRSEKGSFAKPHPHALEKCLAQLGLAKYETAFVGNSDEDIAMARNAKVFSIFIDRQEHVFESPQKPDLKISTLEELKVLL